MRVVLCDTSPLRYLILIGQSHLFEQLYGRILIPAKVAEELQAERTPDAVRLWMQTPPLWLEIREPADTTGAAHVSTALHAGERHLLLGALTWKPDLIVMDDRAGVVEAQRLGFTVTGTLGVLARGAELGLVDLKLALRELQGTNFRVHPKLLAAMLAMKPDEDASLE
jgi:predicted nucleic acid-binding protein